MNIHFNLKSPNREVSPIRIIITHRGKVYRNSTGLSCKTAKWSKSKEKTGHAPTDKKLAEIHSYLLANLDEFSTESDIKQSLSVLFHPEKIKAPETKHTPTLMEHYKSWSEKPMAGLRQRKLMYNNFVKLYPDATWDSITPAFSIQFTEKMQRKGWSVNYIGLNLKSLKTVMHEGYKLGYHSNGNWQELHAASESSDNIYLTSAEMERLWDCNFNLEMLRKARDLAWLGYLTCARFSDYSRLSKDSIGTDGMIRFSQQKTSRAVVLPCSPRVREILERNGGKAPKLAQQNFNDAIKDACRIAGITDKVEHITSKGTRHIREVVDKCDLVSSHTFRRSAATNLYLQGVPLRSIMQLTGHSSIAMLEKYLKVGGEENASRLADNPFFK